ncbi:MAG: hypothetical protein GC201_09605 [Alphaproteobacteria bacterium]|nr:hypothetical protein [Alphaproteobacteria bacterium]
MILHILQLALIALLGGGYGLMLYRRRTAAHMTGRWGRAIGVAGVMLMVWSGALGAALAYTALRALP